MTQYKDIADLTQLLLAEARAHQQRRVLVISGEQNWCRQTVQIALAGTELQNITLWITDQAPAGTSILQVRSRQANSLLGRENTALVFDAHCGFDPDAFGAVTGTITGGGLLFLLIPPLSQWPAFADPEYSRIIVHPYRINDISGRFLRRLSRIIHTDNAGMTLIRQHQPLPAVVRSADSSLTPPDNPDRIGTDDQDRAIAAIMKVATGHRRRPLVITANRGRGKSSAFGIAAAKLLLLDYGHILVTGPQFTAVQPIFEHARRLLPQARIAGPVLHYAGKTMEFVAPDELLRTEKKTDLLLVDEAAAIPAYLLEQLLDRYARIAFATTIHGYEGSGRGFSLRFNKILDRRTPGWKSLQLEKPIRWAADDPLEHFLFRTLLLDAAPAADTAVARVQPEDCVMEQLDRDRLVEDETMLAQLFGLLVLAHYRTRPYDLRYLLDGANLEIYVVRYRGNILATALVAIEGQLDSNITQDIYRGYRRLQGHLIPQMLIAQLGLPEAANMTGARIMRIAVHPLLQRLGFGTHLINHIDKRMQQNNYDWIGSSFGATPELLNFWIRLGQLPVRLGFTREASSGAHSLLMLKPFSDTAAGLCQRARVRFLDSLPYLLADPLSDFDPELTAPLLADSAANADPSMLSVSEWSEIEAFAFHQRNYQDSLRAIHKLTVMALRTPDIAGILKPQQQIALIGRVLQKRSWQDIAGLTEVSGRAQVIALLQQTFRIIHAYFHPDTSGG